MTQDASPAAGLCASDGDIRRGRAPDRWGAVRRAATLSAGLLSFTDSSATGAAAAGADPAAQSSPVRVERYEAQYLEASTIHLAGNEGAINRRRQVELHIGRAASGQVDVVEAGLRYENNLYPHGSQQEQIDWKNTWRGSWVVQRTTVLLRLKQIGRSCQRILTRGGQPGRESKPCAPTSATLDLTCQQQTVELRAAPHAPAAAPRQQRVWMCQLGAAADVGDTPLPWVFAADQCVRTLPGMFGGRASYAPCEPMPPAAAAHE